ncbi:MAG: DinB family protein [Thermomicrobiales bacterium]
MTGAERAQLIVQYEGGHEAILAVLEGITPEELEAREGEGEWSVREIVHHLGDSEMTAAIRIRLLLAEENPTIQGYDQEAFVRNLRYDLDIQPPLAAFAAARAVTAPLLHLLSDADWQRVGVHTEQGPYSGEDWLRIYGRHAHEHADQIRRARAAR